MSPGSSNSCCSRVSCINERSTGVDLLVQMMAYNLKIFYQDFLKKGKENSTLVCLHERHWHRPPTEGDTPWGQEGGPWDLVCSGTTSRGCLPLQASRLDVCCCVKPRELPLPGQGEGFLLGLFRKAYVPFLLHWITRGVVVSGPGSTRGQGD